MPDTKNLLGRQEAALNKIAKALGVEVSTLRGEAKGDPQLARTLEYENIATAVAAGVKSAPKSEAKESKP